MPNKVIHFFKEAGILLKETFISWKTRDPFRNSTVISYYTIFSLPGLGVIIINIAGYFFGEEAMTDQVSSQISGMIGEDAANTVQNIISNAYTSEGFTLSSIISLATLIFGATGVFYQVQQTLNIMWEVEPKPKQKVLKLLKDRLFSFGMILTIGFLLVVSLIASSMITALSNWLAGSFFGVFETLLKFSDFLLSLGIITVLFAAMYKVLPDVEIRWKDVWVGAFVTSILFTIAKFGLGIYFGMSDPGSVYGAAGSIILLMLWTTYSALILLFGAEFTQVYARRYGINIKPSEHAEFNHSKKKQPVNPEIDPESERKNAGLRKD